MILQNPMWLCLLLLLPVSWFFLRRKGCVRNTAVSNLPAGRLATCLRLIPNLCFVIAYASLLVALSRPMIPDKPTIETIIGRDIMVAVDISLSMVAELDGDRPEAAIKTPELDTRLPASGLSHKDNNPFHPDAPKEGKMRRIDGAQAAVLNFIRNRHLALAGDRIGMIVFDSHPRVAWPLTHDLRMIYRKGQFVYEGLGGGTNFGGDPPGPIDLAVAQFKELGQADSKIMILVSDGEDNLDSNTQERLHNLIVENGIHFYVIGVGPALAKKDVDIMRVADRVGGKVYRAESSEELNKCFSAIDKLERSPIKYEAHANEQNFFYFFAGLSLVCLLAALCGEFLFVNQ
ncbi:MAG: VWA domain-containing protein [Candidatus Obscuribacterales bacterium]|nr:VWA domain-containing protein [Candidatus Obscuribacterales bacterium]